MSVVVRSPSGQLLLFCKGADSVIYERLRAKGNEFRDVRGLFVSLVSDLMPVSWQLLLYPAPSTG